MTEFSPGEGGAVPAPKQRLIDEPWKAFHRLWSIRVALFFAALNGAVLGLAAFVDVFNPWLFMALNVLGYTLLIGARLLKQPGSEA
jgi:hypothetical protein